MNAFKIAVTSKDGRVVDSHFGHADEIRFYEVDENGIRYLGTKPVRKYCGEDKSCEEDASSESGGDDAISALNDCAALVTRMIGAEPEHVLSEMGVRSFLSFELVEDALRSAYRQLG